MLPPDKIENIIQCIVLGILDNILRICGSEKLNKIFSGEEHIKKILTRIAKSHNTENLRGSATCLHPPETSGRKFHNNREITMFGLKTLSASLNPMYTQVHSHT